MKDPNINLNDSDGDTNADRDYDHVSMHRKSSKMAKKASSKLTQA